MSDATPECRTVMNRMGLPNLPKFKLGESDEEKAEKAEKAGRPEVSTMERGCGTAPHATFG